MYKQGLCVLGRGIEQAQNGKWLPTRLIEKPSPQGGHTGYRHLNLDPNDTVSRIAGSNANIIAATHLFTTLANMGKAPQVVIFAAGRPSYLAQYPDPALAEGGIMAAKFVRLIQKRHRLEVPEIVIFQENKTTWDDTISSLLLADEQGLSRLWVITVSVHIARAREFFFAARAQNDSFGKIRVGLISSDKYLRRRYDRWRHIKEALLALLQSTAYERTEMSEQAGIRAFWAGTYRFSQEEP